MTPKRSSARSPPSLAGKATMELAKIRQARAEKSLVVVKPYCPHQPSPKQKLYLALDCEEAFYGGAAGGGKSDALIEAALQYIDVPSYSAGLFRRQDVDLRKPGAILERARRWFAGTAAKWVADMSAFRFPSGATIHFGFAPSEKFVEANYQGSEFQFIGIDELASWDEKTYLFLFSRLRRLEGTPVPIRMRPAGNPGGRGAEWIRRRFIDFAKHTGDGTTTVKELVKLHKLGEQLPEPPVYVSPPSTEAVAVAKKYGMRAQGAYFVPAYAEDNPGLDRAAYMMALTRMTADRRAQLEHGDWWATGGGRFFEESWFKFAPAMPAGIRELRAWDLASTEVGKNKDPDWTAGVRGGAQMHRDPMGDVIRDVHTNRPIKETWISDVRRMRGPPGEVEAYLQKAARDDGRRVPIYIEQEPGSAGKQTIHNYKTRVLAGSYVFGEPKTGSKAVFWETLSSDAQRGLLWLVEGPWNSEFIGELVALTDDDSHAHDDMADAAGLLRTKLDTSDLDKLRAWGSQ